MDKEELKQKRIKLLQLALEITDQIGDDGEFVQAVISAYKAGSSSDGDNSLKLQQASSLANAFISGCRAGGENKNKKKNRKTTKKDGE